MFGTTTNEGKERTIFFSSYHNMTSAQFRINFFMTVGITAKKFTFFIQINIKYMSKLKLYTTEVKDREQMKNASFTILLSIAFQIIYIK